VRLAGTNKFLKVNDGCLCLGDRVVVVKRYGGSVYGDLWLSQKSEGGVKINTMVKVEVPELQ